MRHVAQRVAVCLAVLGSGLATAAAEDVVVTTYYPSPRGVYDELRTAGDVIIGSVTSAPINRLDVRGGILAANGLPTCAGGGTAPEVGYGFVGVEFCGDTGMFSDSDGRLSFYSNNNPGMQIEVGVLKIPNDYSVGMGFPTATPEVPLARLHVVRGAGAARTFRADDSLTAFPGDDVTPFLIDDVGRVGIGLDAPVVPLHVRRTGGAQSAVLIDDGTGPGTPDVEISNNGRMTIGGLAGVDNQELSVYGRSKFEMTSSGGRNIIDIDNTGNPLAYGGFSLYINDNHDDGTGSDPTPFSINPVGIVNIGNDVFITPRPESQGLPQDVGAGDMFVSGGDDGVFYIQNTNTSPTAFPDAQQTVLMFSDSAGGAVDVARFHFDRVPALQSWQMLRGDLVVEGFDPVTKNPTNRALFVDAMSATAPGVMVRGNMTIADTNVPGPTGKGNLAVAGNLNVAGKVNAAGGIDPPYVSFTEETHASIREHAKAVAPYEKVMTFWHAAAHRMEVYVISEDAFYTMDGQRVDEHP